jgi:hypothetical protein
MLMTGNTMHTRRSFTVCCWLCAMLSGLLWFIFAGGFDRASRADEPGAVKLDETGRYEWRAEHDLNGIGKFYMGREIAHVMGVAAAAWLERDTREKEEQTNKMIASLKLNTEDGGEGRRDGDGVRG